MTTTKDYKSALAQAIESQPRKAYCFRVDGFFKAGSKVVPAVAVIRSNKNEDDDAIVAAHKYVAEKAKAAGDGAAEAKSEGDLLTDAKNVEIIYRLCREVDLASVVAAPDDPSAWKATQWGAFPGPDWMRKNLSSDQLAALLHLILEVKRKEAPDPGDIDDDAMETIVKLCNEHAATDVPEAVLARFSRVKLTHAIVLLSVKLTQARLSVDTLLAQAEAAEAARGSDTLEPAAP
jgi:hypothetical protein